MTQDEKWIARYNEVVTFIETNKRNPSKYDAEERGNIWFMVHGSCFMVHGSWSTDGSWFMVTIGSWFMVHDPHRVHGQLMVHGSWFMVHGQLTVHGSWLMVHGSWFMVHGSWQYMVHGS